MDNKHHDIDELFGKAFSNYEATPPFNMWQKIEGSLPPPDTDKLFKDAFENYEVEPDPIVWERVRAELPISLILRNTLVYMSRVAAVLLVGMSVYVFLQYANPFGNQTQMAVVPKEMPTQLKPVLETPALRPEAAKTATEQPLAAITTPIHTQRAPKMETFRNDSPYNNPDNSIKGGEVLKTKKSYEEAVINVDAIARRMKVGDNSRISSSELFWINKVEEEVAEKSVVDSSKLIQKVKYEDYFAAADAEYMNRKINTPRAAAQPQNQTNALYLSLQGNADSNISGSTYQKPSQVKRKRFNFKLFKK